MLASVIRELIAPVVQYCPKECGMVSITEIEVSKDFAHATVLISALQEPALAIEHLESQLPALQQKLGNLYRKRIPKLRFRIDPRTEKGSKIDRLLEEA